MTQRDYHDQFEARLKAELESINAQKDEVGIIVSVPMTPDYLPPNVYKRVKSGLWFHKAAKDYGWMHDLQSKKLEYIFQAGVEHGRNL